MKFVLETSPYMSGEFLSVPEDCTAFVIDIDAEYAKRLLHWMDYVKETATSENGLYSMNFWDYSGDYHQLDEENSCPDHHEGEIAYRGEPAAMECNQVTVRADDVCWKAIPKHDSMYILSDSVSRQQLENIVNAVQQA